MNQSQVTILIPHLQRSKKRLSLTVAFLTTQSENVKKSQVNILPHIEIKGYLW